MLISNNIENVQVESEVRNSGNVKIPKSNQRPELTESDEGFIYYDYNLKKMILWTGKKWMNLDGTKL